MRRKNKEKSSVFDSFPLQVITFKPRFVPAHMLGELSNLWHLSRVPCDTRYDRLLWTSREFNKAHPELTSLAVYKDLDAMLKFGGY